MKKVILLLSIALCLCACSSEKFKDNQVYVIESNEQERTENFVDWLDVEGQNPFSADLTSHIMLLNHEILLTVAPDGESYYVMTYSEEQSPDIVLKGADYQLVNISRVESKTQIGQTIAQNVPFVIKAGWNSSGDIVAFGGHEQLIIYDVHKNQLLLQSELADEPMRDFFWSPIDTNKLYVDQFHSTGIVYYVDPQKRAELYETREKIYYKALLEKNYYYATQWRSDPANEKEQLYTILADDKRQIIKIVGHGAYLDSYQKSVLLLGEDGFGLTYVSDVNQVSQYKLLSENYIYDAGFYAGGNSYAVISDEAREQNDFILILFDVKGEEIQRLTLSGGGIFLANDGILGYCSGPKQEIIDLTQGKVLVQSTPMPHGVDEALLATVRPAAVLYGELEQKGDIPLEIIENYFLDLDGLAKTQMMSAALKSTAKTVISRLQIVLAGELSAISAEGNKATVVLVMTGASNDGSQLDKQLVWDLTFVRGKWYVTGFSNFALTPLYRSLSEQNYAYLREEKNIPADETLIQTELQFFTDDELAWQIELANQARIIMSVPSVTVIWRKDASGLWQIETIEERIKQTVE